MDNRQAEGLLQGTPDRSTSRCQTQYLRRSPGLTSPDTVRRGGACYVRKEIRTKKDASFHRTSDSCRARLILTDVGASCLRSTFRPFARERRATTLRSCITFSSTDRARNAVSVSLARELVSVALRLVCQRGRRVQPVRRR